MQVKRFSNYYYYNLVIEWEFYNYLFYFGLKQTFYRFVCGVFLSNRIKWPTSGYSAKDVSFLMEQVEFFQLFRLSVGLS